jgi:S-DNA-T family DNA segregation ATPase FtsK/SpoIIIE
MLGILGMVKIVSLGACVTGAWMTYNNMPQTQIRKQMIKCFQAGGIYLTLKNKKFDQKVFPTISRVSFLSDRMQVAFILPTGLDPKEVMKHDWAFKQVFGNQIKLEGDSKYFTLMVYPKPIEMFSYKYDQLVNIITQQKLPIIAGQSRESFMSYDMVEHPHLLIAGETGAGKSTQLRSILTFFMQHLTPDQLQLYMADMKMSEFHLFKHMPHVQYNETNEKKVYAFLVKIEHEMKRRGKLLNDNEQAHIDDLPSEHKLPYIVVCIDEFALLKKEKKTMELVEEISSIGRALGVFLILSCLRPDAEIMDGKLKQNLTVRMAFRAADAINSRIVIGTDGAEQIKQSQKGLMLLKLDGLHYVQAPYLGLKEAKEILDPLKVKIDEGTRQSDHSESREIPCIESGPSSVDTLQGITESHQDDQHGVKEVKTRRSRASRHQPKEIPILPEPDIFD